jgi:hypothetical protein
MRAHATRGLRANSDIRYRITASLNARAASEEGKNLDKINLTRMRKPRQDDSCIIPPKWTSQTDEFRLLTKTLHFDRADIFGCYSLYPFSAQRASRNQIDTTSSN